MEQFEKVCKGLKRCCGFTIAIDPCVGCEYKDANCIKNIMHDALALIQQQQERIKKLEAAIAGWEKFAPFLYAHGMLPAPPKEEI